MTKRKSNTPEYLYHYTSIHHLPGILNLGQINLTESNLRYDVEMYRPVVWLTDTDDSTRQGLEGSIANKQEVKITIKHSLDFIPWISWSRSNNIDFKWSRFLTQGKNYESWWVSEQPVPCEQFLKIENTVTGRVYYRSSFLSQSSPREALAKIRD